jgi:hypothetical protein
MRLVATWSTVALVAVTPVIAGSDVNPDPENVEYVGSWAVSAVTVTAGPAIRVRVAIYSVLLWM